MPSGEKVTAREVQDALNKCDVAADLVAADEKLIKAQDLELKNTYAKLALVQEQLAAYKEIAASYEKAVTEYQKALQAAKDGAEARDKELAMYKDRVKQLEGKKRGAWKRLGDILIGAAIIAVLR